MRALFRDRRGAISVELAILAHLVLLPVVLGAADAGALVTARSRLDQVLHQALFYAYANNGTVSAASIAGIATQAFGGGAPAVSASTVQYCIVPAAGYPATGLPSVPGSGGACGSVTQSVQTYLLLTASVAVALPFPVPWTARTVTLSLSSQVRIS